MLEEDIKIIANIPEKKIIFGEEKKERFKKETKCWMCKGEFNDDKVRDIAILLVGIEELHTTNVILSIENLILRP